MKGYWCASIVSTAHALAVVPLGWRALESDFPTSVLDLDYKSRQMAICVSISLGYIISDLGCALYYRENWPGHVANIIHHTLFCTGLLCTLSTGSMLGVSCLGCCMEITSPLVNLRWHLAEMDYKDTVLYMVNGGLMAILWFLFRIILYGWIFAQLFSLLPRISKHQNAPYMLYVCAEVLVGYVLQFYWFERIAQGALRTLGCLPPKKKDKKSKKAQD